MHAASHFVTLHVFHAPTPVSFDRFEQGPIGIQSAFMPPNPQRYPRSSLLPAASALLCLACVPEPLQPTFDPNHQQLVTDEYTLEPGTEKYMCYTFFSPSDRTVTITELLATSGLGAHHVALFQTTRFEPEGPFECPELVRLNWQPIWAGGAGSPALSMPPGVGFEILPGTQYLVQLHLQNASDQAIIDHSRLDLTYADETERPFIQPAGIYALGKFSLDIPAGAKDHTQDLECKVDRSLNVFAAFPHMHRLGTRIELFHGPDETDAKLLYELDPWPFDDQPMDPVDWRIDAGDYVRARCHWDNPGSQPVHFGESSDDEMCFFVMFYYPFESLAGCLSA